MIIRVEFHAHSRELVGVSGTDKRTALDPMQSGTRLGNRVNWPGVSGASVAITTMIDPTSRVLAPSTLADGAVPHTHS